MYRVRISGLQFAWDEAKERSNRRRHGVSFVEAATAFNDPDARRIFDAAHSESNRAKLLVVCHCYREGNTIRIISARKADAKETKDYEGQRHDA